MKKYLLVITVLHILCLGFSISTKANDTFSIFKDGKVANIYVSEKAEPQIKRAVGDLQKDIKMLTGIEPTIVHSFKKAGNNVIIIGAIQQADINKIQKTGKVDETIGMEKLSQSFLLKCIENPNSKIKKALVVAGSDALGTIYGIYEISERIGVSPLYWWCDVVPKKQSSIILQDCLVLPKEPSVKYRGIFINDEEALTQWSEKTSPNKYNVHPSPEVYKRVFELLLRLKANAIWPAMMHRSSYFFEAKDENGIPVNPQNAKEYGIYVGSSHCENMARNNYDEWYDWAAAHKDMYDAKGEPLWDYTVNPKAIEAYWQERLDESKDFNMIYTLGIRGVHDSPFRFDNMENPTLEKKVKLLQTVINRQREMIKETFGAEDAVPQIFVPYEETGELYNGESKDGKEKCAGIQLPEDVITVWTEDNFGYTRQLPRPHEQKRAGGNGIYYHLAYQGGPTTYDWLYTTPLPLIQEELRKVYDNKARNFWIVNVGDIKPAEMGLQFFMSLAYNINSYPKNTSKDFLQKSSKQQFGVNDNKAKEIAELITDFHNLCRPKKPEVMTPFWDWTFQNTWLYQYYSLFDFNDESLQQLQKANELEQRAKNIMDEMDESAQTTFWHLAYYPIRSTHLMFKKINYYRRNVAYNKQGRFASVKAYKELSEQAEADIQADLETYKQIADAKWNGIMDPYANYNYKERVFDVANIPNNLVYDVPYLEEATKGIGSVCEGQAIGDEKIELRFSSFENNQRFIDIFNRETKPNDWTIESDVNWLIFSKSSGKLAIDERIWLGIDWQKTTKGENKAIVTVKDTHGNSKSYPILASKYDFDLKEKSYAEGNGYVAIEAEHYTTKQAGENKAQWVEYEQFGYTGSSMFVKGGNKVEQNIKANGARLDYSVYFSSTGTFYGQVYRIPTLNEGKGKTCEIAIGLNDEEPQVLTGIRHKGQLLNQDLPDGTKETLYWRRNILMQMEKVPFIITVDKPGYHTVSVYQVNTDIGFDRLVICTDKQAKTLQRRALLGCPTSYNTFTAHKSVKKALLPVFPANTKLKAYPKPAPLTEAKLNFALYAMMDAHGFEPVNQRHIFDPNKNTFGWRAEDVKGLWMHHDESSNRIPFWQRDGLTGKKKSKFYVKLKKGNYKVRYYMGDSRIREEWIYSKGRSHDITFKMNGKELLNEVKTTAGKQIIETVDIEIGNDELLELEISGKWIINALEITRK